MGDSCLESSSASATEQQYCNTRLLGLLKRTPLLWYNGLYEVAVECGRGASIANLPCWFTPKFLLSC